MEPKIMIFNQLRNRCFFGHTDAWIFSQIGKIKLRTRKKFVVEELPNSSETEDIRKVGRFYRTLQ